MNKRNKRDDELYDIDDPEPIIFGAKDKSVEPEPKKKKPDVEESKNPEIKYIGFSVSNVEFFVEEGLFSNSDLSEYTGGSLTIEKLKEQNKKNDTVSNFKYNKEIEETTKLLLETNAPCEVAVEKQASFFNTLINTKEMLTKTKTGLIVLDRDPEIFGFIVSLYRNGLDINLFKKVVSCMTYMELMKLKAELDFYMILPRALDIIQESLDGRYVNYKEYVDIEHPIVFRKNGTSYEPLETYIKYPAVFFEKPKSGEGIFKMRNYIWLETPPLPQCIGIKAKIIDLSFKNTRFPISNGMIVSPRSESSYGNNSRGTCFVFGLMTENGKFALQIQVKCIIGHQTAQSTTKMIMFSGESTRLWTNPTLSCEAFGPVENCYLNGDDTMVFYDALTHSIKMVGSGFNMITVVDGLYLNPKEKWHLCLFVDQYNTTAHEQSPRTTKMMIRNLIEYHTDFLKDPIFTKYFLTCKCPDTMTKELWVEKFNRKMALYLSRIIFECGIVPEDEDIQILCNAAVNRHMDNELDDVSIEEVPKKTNTNTPITYTNGMNSPITVDIFSHIAAIMNPSPSFNPNKRK